LFGLDRWITLRATALFIDQSCLSVKNGDSKDNRVAFLWSELCLFRASSGLSGARATSEIMSECSDELAVNAVTNSLVPSSPI
jgi:hypothetical protein